MHLKTGAYLNSHALNLVFKLILCLTAISLLFAKDNSILKYHIFYSLLWKVFNYKILRIVLSYINILTMVPQDFRIFGKKNL